MDGIDHTERWFRAVSDETRTVNVPGTDYSEPPTVPVSAPTEEHFGVHFWIREGGVVTLAVATPTGRQGIELSAKGVRYIRDLLTLVLEEEPAVVG